MAEPVGIFIEIDINEDSVKKLLNHKFEDAKFSKKLGYYFSELLYGSYANLHESIFIFNYDKKNQKCFIAYLLNHFSDADIVLFPKILEIICTLKISNTTNYAIVASVFPDLYRAYQLKQNQVAKQSLDNFSKDIVEQIMNKFWSFQDYFHNPKKALNKQNYFYKNFKNYFNRFRQFMKEVEKPQRIAQATQENPLWLFDDFYTYDNVVFYKSVTKSFVELPKADPLTLRDVSLGIIADKNDVFIKQIAPHSPSLSPDAKNYLDIIWEYKVAKGVDGESLEPFGTKHETTYWKDKNSIYYNKELKKIKHADRNSFEELNFGMGKDKDHVFFRDKVIPIDVNNFSLNKNGFIYDSKNIFHYQHQIPLDAKTFKVVEYESEQNPFMGTFVLEDKHGKYEYNSEWKDKIIKPITRA